MAHNINDTFSCYALSGLDDLRVSIDRLDTALVYLLAERTHLIIQVTILKIIQAIPHTRSDERLEDLDRVIHTAVELNVNKEFIKRFFDNIYNYASEIIKRAYQEPDTEKFKPEYSGKFLDEFRSRMKEIDLAVCNIVAYRINVVKDVGKYKKEHDIKPLAPSRWQSVIEGKKKLARELSISEDFIVAIFDLIHEECLRIEHDICR